MSEKLWNDIENDFLNQLYVRKGAIEVNVLQSTLGTSYGLQKDLFCKIIDRTIQKEYCISEKIRKLDDTETDVVFITYKGLEQLADKKKISSKNILKDRIAYELKCEGYSTYADWIAANRERLVLEHEITCMYARALADMKIISMTRDNMNELNECLEEAAERIKKRADKVPEISNTVAYAVITAIYEKLQSLVGTEKLIDEADTTGKLLESYMPLRHEMTIDFI